MCKRATCLGKERKFCNILSVILWCVYNLVEMLVAMQCN